MVRFFFLHVSLLIRSIWYNDLAPSRSDQYNIHCNLFLRWNIYKLHISRHIVWSVAYVIRYVAFASCPCRNPTAIHTTHTHTHAIITFQMYRTISAVTCAMLSYFIVQHLDVCSFFHAAYGYHHYLIRWYHKERGAEPDI